MVSFITVLFFLIFQINILYSKKIKRHSFDIFKQNHVTFIESHRGVNKEFPQNTIRAFERAIDYEIDGIELDIWLSKDNIPVVVHGGWKGFLYFYYKNAFGFVTNYLLDELKELEVIGGNDKMPTLEEVFKIAKDKLFINIEIKDNRYEKLFPILIDLLIKYDMFDQVSLSSFYHDYVDYVIEFNENHEKKIEFGFLYKKKIIFDHFRYDVKNTSLNIYYTDATKEICDKAHKNGMAVIAWFGMNDVETNDIYKSLFENGVDSIISNYPKEAKAFRDNYFNNFIKK
jgi:glycerophosphoryl diester phosphodiesterase